MRVVAYNIQSFEKEPLAIANQKKHDITLISNSLSEDTVIFASGKEAVILFGELDDISEIIVDKLVDFGVKYMLILSSMMRNIERPQKLKMATLPTSILTLSNSKNSKVKLAQETIKYLDTWAQSKS